MYLICLAFGKPRIGIYEIRKGGLLKRNQDFRVLDDMGEVLSERAILFRRHQSALEHILDFCRGEPCCNATLAFASDRRLNAMCKICNLSVLVAIDDYRVLKQLHTMSQITGVRLIGVQHAHLKEATGKQYRKFPFDIFVVWSDYYARKYADFVEPATSTYLLSEKFSCKNFCKAKSKMSKK